MDEKLMDEKLMDRLTGCVKWFNEAKGWGFITRNGCPDTFVHFSEIEGDGFKTLKENELVEFEAEMTPRGLCAKRVRVIK